MAQFDTLILNGTIVDGTRTPRFQGSVGIKDGAIAAVSRDALPAGAANQVGMPADVVVYDLENLRSTPPEVAFDFPAGEWRRIQKAEGYRWIFVNGEATFIDGECTNKTPGRLLRHGAA